MFILSKSQAIKIFNAKESDMKKNIFLAICILLLPLSIYAQQIKPVDYVNPLIGTHDSRWMLFPGPTMPFGMVKLSPDNQKAEWKGGYEYDIPSIAGFSHIHSWAMAGLLLMPTTGPLKIEPGLPDDPDSGYRSRFRHATEVAQPGYYAATLDDYHIRAELTATTRCGFQRYTFPASDSARVLIDLKIPTEYGYDLDWGSVRKVSDTEIEGFAKEHTFDGFSSLDNDYTIHFVIRFNKPFSSLGGWSNGVIFRDFNEIQGHGDVGAFVTFKTTDQEKIEVESGISLVSIEQARLNLDTELNPYKWNFDAVREHARSTWNQLLSTIKVEGSTDKDRIKFYTNMYRSYSARTIWSDVNGKFVDMNEQVAQVADPNDPVYGCDAFWNTFWNLNQLWELATPDIANKWVKSLLEINRRGGWLPKGPTGIEYSSIMVASHEIDLINSAYQAGIRNYDAEEAYEAVKHMQMVPGQAYPGGGLVGNRQLAPYMKLGYVPYGKATRQFYFGDEKEGPTSNTLEYCFDDWNVAQFAKSLNKTGDYRYFMKRAHNYLNVFDSTQGYVRPKRANGQWVTAKSVFGDQARSDSWKGTGFIEGNAWQYTWFVPHDVNAVVRLLGRDEFINRLDKGFEESRKTHFNASKDLFTQYPINHGNQPNMQAAYLFDFSGKPWLTQKWSREIMDLYYGSNPADGWLGDEDQGQMGAWFVMSAMGLFQMDGGGSTLPVYEIGTPIFHKITITLDPKYFKGGGEFEIIANNVSDSNRYIQAATLNGKTLNKPWFYRDELKDGGKLIFQMGPKPNKKWGSSEKDAPPSMSHPAW